MSLLSDLLTPISVRLLNEQRNETRRKNIESIASHIDFVVRTMNNLFDQGKKRVIFHRKRLEQCQIKSVLNPLTQTFIDENLAKELKILSNGYYRNSYGGLIPLNIAAKNGFVRFEFDNLNENEQMEIEYSSSNSPMIAHLLIEQIWNPFEEKMIGFRSAIESNLLDLNSFRYFLNENESISIHQAFYRGFIVGQLKTSLTSTRPMLIVEKSSNEFDDVFSSLTNLINSLSEFRNSFEIRENCELTTDGFIRDKQTNQTYLLSEAIEIGSISFRDLNSSSLHLSTTNFCK